MTQNENAVTTARIGERGRLILPVQVQRAAHVGSGDTVAVRTAPDGTITIEPLRTVIARVRATFVPLLEDHLPAGPARMLAGGRALTEDSGPLPIPLHPLPERRPIPEEGRPVLHADTRAVFTARAVLAWLAAAPGDRIGDWLPHAVLPEPAVTELYTVLAHARAHARADALLADLTVLGVQLPTSAQHRAALAEDTAFALELTADAARAGVEVPMPDARCAAAAHRLGLPLFAADLVPTQYGA